MCPALTPPCKHAFTCRARLAKERAAAFRAKREAKAAAMRFGHACRHPHRHECGRAIFPRRVKCRAAEAANQANEEEAARKAEEEAEVCQAR